MFLAKIAQGPYFNAVWIIPNEHIHLYIYIISIYLSLLIQTHKSVNEKAQ